MDLYLWVHLVLGSPFLIGSTTATSRPFECQFSNIGFEPCNVTCGVGYKHKELIESCDEPRQLEEECYVGPCPQHCQYEWTCWSQCSDPCGSEGTRCRDRVIVKPALFGGNDCPPLNPSDTQERCNDHPCPTDCFDEGWSDWSSCDSPCDGGYQSRIRVNPTTPVSIRYGENQVCPDVNETIACNPQPCPVDCVVDEWSDWSPCKRQCESERQERWRQVLNYSQNGGADCGPLYQSKSCPNCDCRLDALRWQCEKYSRAINLALAPCSKCYVDCEGNYGTGNVRECTRGTRYNNLTGTCQQNCIPNQPWPPWNGPGSSSNPWNYPWKRPAPPPPPPPPPPPIRPYYPPVPVRPHPPVPVRPHPPVPVRPPYHPVNPYPGYLYPPIPYRPKPSNPAQSRIPSGFCLRKRNGKYADTSGSRCNGRFITCRSKVTIEKWCASPQVFNPSSRTCVLPSTINCP